MITTMAMVQFLILYSLLIVLQIVSNKHYSVVSVQVLCNTLGANHLQYAVRHKVGKDNSAEVNEPF